MAARPSPSDLLSQAQAVLGEDERILAAGIFGLQDRVLATAAATVAGAEAGGAVFDSPLDAGVGAAAGVHATREAVARSSGLTVRMLVSVTEQKIHVLDWVGSGPTRELLSFDRATTDVQVRRFGLSRRLSLADATSGTSLGLTGSTAFFSVVAKGDKSVLRALSQTR